MNTKHVSALWLALLLTGCLAGGQAQGAILNSLRGFSRAQEGFGGVLSGEYAAQGGNTEETAFQLGGRVQMLCGDDLVRFLARGKRKTAGGEESAKSVTLHLRHNHRLGGRFSTLSFIQVQEDPFKLLKSRTLVGLGGRWDVVARDGREVALGAAAMWEGERLDGREGRRDEQRLSAFISLVLPLRPGLELDTLAFYQPAWSAFDDHRLFWQISLDVELTGALSLNTGLQVEYDSEPPAGVGDTDWETVTGISARF